MSRSRQPVPLRIQITMVAAISVFTLGIPTAFFYGSWWIFFYAVAISFVICLLGTIRRM